MSTTCSVDEAEPDRKIGKVTQKLAENKMVLVVLEDGVENYKNKFWDQHKTADDHSHKSQCATLSYATRENNIASLIDMAFHFRSCN